MKKLFLVFTLISLVSFAQKKQEEKKVKIELPTKQVLRAGNASYKQNDFFTAEKNYRKALELNPNYDKANYNLGNSVYHQKKYAEAVPMYDLAAKTTKDKVFKAENYHNIGNAMMKQKKYAEAIKAYKNALRNNPNDDETRYNLALAQKMLKNQADNKKDDKNNKDKNDKNDKNKDDKKKKKKDEKDNKKNKDEGDGDKDKDKKGDNKEDPNKDKKGESDKKKKQPQQPQKNQLSKQQIKQLLEAMNNEENKTQKKVNAKKAKGRKIKQEKDW